MLETTYTKTPELTKYVLDKNKKKSLKYFFLYRIVPSWNNLRTTVKIKQSRIIMMRPTGSIPRRRCSNEQIEG